MRLWVTIVKFSHAIEFSKSSAGSNFVTWKKKREIAISFNLNVNFLVNVAVLVDVEKFDSHLWDKTTASLFKSWHNMTCQHIADLVNFFCYFLLRCWIIKSWFCVNAFYSLSFGLRTLNTLGDERVILNLSLFASLTICLHKYWYNFTQEFSNSISNISVLLKNH